MIEVTSADKAGLRAEAKTARKRFTRTPDAAREAEALQTVIRERWKDYPTVFLYTSFGSEFPTDGLIREALREGKRVGLPRIGQEGQMRFHRYLPGDSLEAHPYGMKEPLEGSPVLEPDEHTLILVPGLLFDTDGYRLGYGGGYYDRYLAKYPQAHSCGIGYSVQLVPALSCLDTQDIPLKEIWIKEGAKI